MQTLSLDSFISDLKKQISKEALSDFARKRVLHGVPYVFKGREDDYYEFRKSIANQFSVSFHEIYIMGSAKLGFSHLNKTNFSFDSDIDVAIISSALFDEFMRKIAHFQMQFRESREKITERELAMYHVFLEYVAMGWMRPDKLPISFSMKTVKDDWFDYFKTISNGKSTVGNYDVRAGVFKSYQHLEDYIVEGLFKAQNYQDLKANP